MQRQADRYSAELQVEVYTAGQRHCLALHDVSTSGMFLLTRSPLPVGTEVRIAISIAGNRLVTAARVTQTLSEPDAAAAGRAPGMGLAFRQRTTPLDAQFATAIEQLIRHRAHTMSDEPALRGNLADLNLATVLTLLELERKTGRLSITGIFDAWIDLLDGQIVGAGPATSGNSSSIVMSILDWTRGAFELSTRASITDTGFAMPITHLLIEHARLRDETSRPVRRPDVSDAAYA